MKTVRQNTIINLIETYEIETQEELCERLKNAGFVVTQATVSRDIRELKLTKLAGPSGRARYVRYSQPVRSSPSQSHNTIFREAVRNVDTAKNILVIKTNSGMAQAVGAAVDAMGIPEIVGCIAGDDTLMCAMRSDEDAIKLKNKLMTLLNN